MGFVLTILLAMMAQWGIGNYGGRGSGGIASLFRTPAERNPPAQSGKPDTTTPGDAGIGGNYAGVILWPEIKSVTTLVAPLSRRGDVLSSSVPLSIPFGGEYWLYRWPYRRPPRHSTTRRGTPAALSFRTTDRVPLKMEAYQKLEHADEPALLQTITVGRSKRGPLSEECLAGGAVDRQTSGRWGTTEPWPGAGYIGT